MEKPPPQLDVDAVGGVAQRIGAQELEDRLEQAQRHHADDQHHQGRHALVDEHFIDDELEEERARKREQLHEERGDQHMREGPAVAQDRGPEPAKAEAVGIRSRPAEPPGDENDGARRESFGFVERHLLRRARDRIDEADPALVGGDRQDGEPAVLKLHNRWIRDGAQALRVHPADHTRLQLQKIGGAEQILLLSQTSSQRQLMTELRRIRGDAVIARDESKGRKPRVRAALRFALRSAASSRGLQRRFRSPWRLDQGGADLGQAAWLQCLLRFGSSVLPVEQISTVESHCS